MRFDAAEEGGRRREEREGGRVEGQLLVRSFGGWGDRRDKVRKRRFEREGMFTPRTLAGGSPV